jgi:hypothetical protein
MEKREEHLQYLKEVAEKPPDSAEWEAWWDAHKQELREWLPLAQWLRMQYNGPRSAGEILERNGIPYTPPKVEPWMPPERWLRELLTLEEVEQRIQDADRVLNGLVAPSERREFLWAEWRALKAKMQAGDECWTFATPQEAWAAKMGMARYALVRDKKIVDWMMTIRN